MANRSGFVACITYILLVLTWLLLINKNVPDPYLVRHADAA